MINIEIKNAKTNAALDEVEIIVDRDGLNVILAQLELLKNGRSEHFHLMSKAWGGHELEDEPTCPGSAAIQHLKFMLR